jgi:hypothetical protein
MMNCVVGVCPCPSDVILVILSPVSAVSFPPPEFK